jgi:hypothetical protein
LPQPLRAPFVIIGPPCCIGGIQKEFGHGKKRTFIVVEKWSVGRRRSTGETALVFEFTTGEPINLAAGLNAGSETPPPVNLFQYRKTNRNMA